MGVRYFSREEFFVGCEVSRGGANFQGKSYTGRISLNSCFFCVFFICLRPIVSLGTQFYAQRCSEVTVRGGLSARLKLSERFFHEDGSSALKILHMGNFPQELLSILGQGFLGKVFHREDISGTI